MQRLEVSGAVRPTYGSLGVRRLTYHYVSGERFKSRFPAKLRRAITELPILLKKIHKNAFWPEYEAPRGGGKEKEQHQQKTEYFKDASAGGWLGEVAFYSIPGAEEKEEQVVSFHSFFLWTLRRLNTSLKYLNTRPVKAHSSASPHNSFRK